MLQAVKLLGSEKGKKGKVNLLFVAGDRLLDSVAEYCAREKSLTSLLG